MVYVSKKITFVDPEKAHNAIKNGLENKTSATIKVYRTGDGNIDMVLTKSQIKRFDTLKKDIIDLKVPYAQLVKNVKLGGNIFQDIWKTVKSVGKQVVKIARPIVKTARKVLSEPAKLALTGALVSQGVPAPVASIMAEGGVEGVNALLKQLGLGFNDPDISDKTKKNVMDVLMYGNGLFLSESGARRGGKGLYNVR